MVGPGLAEPSRESSESEAPPDARDPELEAPLAPAHLEPDCEAKIKKLRANHFLNAGGKYISSIYFMK